MGYQSIPAATKAAGQNNNAGGASSFNSPWGGSGMDLSRAQGLLNPSGIGGGGISKGGIEAFLDPAGMDSGSYGLNLFGHRPDPNANQQTAFPNLGAASMIPKMPGGAFQPMHGTGFNGMADAGAGGRMFNPGQMQQMAPNGAKPTQGMPSMSSTPARYSPSMVRNVGDKVRH